jgi:hypothetical protein
MTCTPRATCTPPAEAKKISVDLFVNFAQFVYDDTNPENPIGPSPTGLPQNDSFLLGWQVGAKINFPHDFYFQLAPTLYNYTGTGDNLTGPFVGDPTFIDAEGNKVIPNQTGVNNLLVFDVPMEFGFKLGELPVRIFGEYARNFSGDTRARAAGHPDKTSEVNAYQIGAGIGKLKEKHSWELRGFWQHAEQFSLDPNLVDTEFWDSQLNLQGIGVTFGYMLSDAVWFALAYGYAEQADTSLGTGGTGNIAINPLKNFQIFQVDLNVRF